jgi:protein-L-isoaspartate(D-aspartate) O-methyltransferase
MEPSTEIYLETARSRLADDIANVVSDDKIAGAFRRVPRHLFTLPRDVDRAYEDRALPLAEDQTISQPSMIALMLKALDLREDQRVLEVGAGCGYAAALLGALVREVDAIEIRPTLAAMAYKSLAEAAVENVRIHLGDGSHGLPERAPFDRILVSAAAREVPTPLISQLAPGGRLVIPVGSAENQELRVGRRSTHGESVEWARGVPCVFVPLVS